MGRRPCCSLLLLFYFASIPIPLCKAQNNEKAFDRLTHVWLKCCLVSCSLIGWGATACLSSVGFSVWKAVGNVLGPAAESKHDVTERSPCKTMNDDGGPCILCEGRHTGTRRGRKERESKKCRKLISMPLEGQPTPIQMNLEGRDTVPADELAKLIYPRHERLLLKGVLEDGQMAYSWLETGESLKVSLYNADPSRFFFLLRLLLLAPDSQARPGQPASLLTSSPRSGKDSQYLYPSCHAVNTLPPCPQHVESLPATQRRSRGSVRGPTASSRGVCV
ncbi:hypothetical protein KC330_g11 [Hortaea werneckii]|nr:hypothetical protein KC330_g11 [Hortaea werneckii]